MTGESAEHVSSPSQPQSTDETCRVREIRRDELAEAVAFAESQGCTIDAERVRTWLSLAAHDEQGRMCGAAFCRAGENSGVTLEVVVAQEASADGGIGLARRLIDTVLGKMRCEHVNRCSIHVHDPHAAQQLWSTTRWADDTAITRAA